jgi:SAM-dependent methyltransferase
MSTTQLERPTIPQFLVESSKPCEERMNPTLDVPTNWVSRTILKSYISSFNFCLGELGWVPKRILEVGSGNGALLSYVAQTFMETTEEIIGIEFDSVKVEDARENNCCKIEFMELTEGETLPFEDGHFDLVISHGFLGNSPLPRHWIKEMARVTAEAMIISTPTPIGFKWLKKFPGSMDAKLLGNPVFSPGTQPIGMRQVKNWIERMDMKTECMTTPVPYGMILARKPQSAK